MANLEQENIKLMSYLFECNNQEVKFIRNVITNQFLDNENLEENSIMNVDLNQLESGKSSCNIDFISVIVTFFFLVRPRSALDLTIRKLREIDLKLSDRKEQLAIEEANEEEDDDNDVIHSQRKLYLDGHRKELIRQPSVTEDEFNAQLNSGEYWPITQEMLNSILKPS